MIAKLAALDWPVVISVSLLTSSIFFLFIALIRPIVTVSKTVLWEYKRENGQLVHDDDGNPIKKYKIKTVNWSMVSLYEVKTEMKVVVPYGDGDGTSSVRYYNVPPLRDTKLAIPNMLGRSGTKYAEYAQVFVSECPIEQKLELSDSAFLEFSMVAKHGLSSYNKVIKRRFTDRKVIKEGNFRYGTSLKMKT